MDGYNTRTTSREMHSNTMQKESADSIVTEVTICLWTVLVSLLLSKLKFFISLTFFTKEKTKQ